MNSIQTKLESIFKEYADLKNYIQEDSKNTDAVKKEVMDQALEMEELKDKADLFFERIGVKEIIKLDFLEVQKKLYYFVEAYKDLIEIDNNILKEVQDYKVKTVFAIIDGKKEVVDKDQYNYYKQQHQEYTLKAEEYIKNQGTL